MKYTEDRKREITVLLDAWVKRYPSRNKAAVAMGIAAATLSAILNNDWEKISAAMWAKVESAIAAPTKAQSWAIAETMAYREITHVMDDARENGAMTWVVGEAGCGKTTTAKEYAATHRNVFYVLCAEDTKKGDFMRDIARSMGIRVDGAVRQMLEQILEALVRLDGPLLVFDEADKLTDSVMQYFITIYNRTEGDVGTVFLSTRHIKSRMARGLQFNRRGYHELNSRIGRKFYDLGPANATDVYNIWVATGIADEEAIRDVIREADAVQYDMRRVRKVARIKAKRA